MARFAVAIFGMNTTNITETMHKVSSGMMQFIFTAVSANEALGMGIMEWNKTKHSYPFIYNYSVLEIEREPTTREEEERIIDHYFKDRNLCRYCITGAPYECGSDHK